MTREEAEEIAAAEVFAMEAPERIRRLEAERDALKDELEAVRAERDAAETMGLANVTRLAGIRSERDAMTAAAQHLLDTSTHPVTAKAAQMILAAALDAPETPTEHTGLITAYAAHLRSAGDRTDAAESVIARSRAALAAFDGRGVNNFDIPMPGEVLDAWRASLAAPETTPDAPTGGED